MIESTRQFVIDQHRRMTGDNTNAQHLDKELVKWLQALDACGYHVFHRDDWVGSTSVTMFGKTMVEAEKKSET